MLGPTRIRTTTVYEKWKNHFVFYPIHCTAKITRRKENIKMGYRHRAIVGYYASQCGWKIFARRIIPFKLFLSGRSNVILALRHGWCYFLSSSVNNLQAKLTNSELDSKAKVVIYVCVCTRIYSWMVWNKKSTNIRDLDFRKLAEYNIITQDGIF